MPGNVGTLVLKADSRGIKKGTDDLKRLDKQAGRTEKATARLGRSFAKIGAGAVAAFALAIRQAVKFERAMAEVSTLLDDTSGIDSLTDSVRELSTQYGAAPVDTAKALYQVISAGASSASEQMLLLNASNRLAIGGVTDVTTAADGLTTILNAYSLEASEATNVSDILFVAMKAGKTTIGEMADSVGQVATIAAQVGVPINELAAAVAALTKKGVKTKVAMTSLRAVLGSVLKPTVEAKEAAADMGLEFNIAALKSKGLAGFLDSVAIATGGSEEKMALLVPQVEALVGVMGLGADGAAEFNKILLATADAAGATAEAYERMAKTSGFQLDRLNAKTQVIAETYGAFYLPALNAVAGGLLKLITPLKSVDSIERDAATASKTMGAALRDMSTGALEAADAMGELAAIKLAERITSIRDELSSLTLFLFKSGDEVKALKEEEARLVEEQGLLEKQLARINALLGDGLEFITVTAEKHKALSGRTKETAEEIDALNSLLEKNAAKTNELWGALSEYNETHAELNILLKEGRIDQATFIEWLDVAKGKFADAQTEAAGLGSTLEEVTVSAKRMVAPESDRNGVLEGLRFELELQGLSNDEREKRIALLNADATATSELGVKITSTLDQIQANQKQMQLMNEIGGSLADNMTNAFTDIALGAKSAKEAFADMAKAIVADIIRIIVQQTIMNALGVAGGGNAGGIGLLGSLFGPGRATGGPVYPGMLHPVTERGPELLDVGNQRFLMSPQGGNVTPITKNSQSTSITVNLPPQTQRITAQQTADEVSRVQSRAVSRNR